MIRLPVLGLILALAMPALGGDDKKGAFKEPAQPGVFHKLSYEKAVDKAKGENKLVMIDFYADWCGPCKLLEARTFSDDKVKQFLKDKTIAVRVDVDENEKLTGKFNISAIPCLVFVDGKGKEVGRIVGFAPADAFLEKAGKIAK